MRRWITVLPLLCLAAAGCRHAPAPPGAPAHRHTRADPRDALDPIVPARTGADRIVNGAKAEARRGVRYDPCYVRISYPGGDVPAGRGACTDVVIRALRSAGYDLQRLIHEDMRRKPSAYRGAYGHAGSDANIDHRRVRNQMVFFRRHGRELSRLTTGPAAATWKPGDIVCWRLDSGLDHCGVLSSERNAQGLPLVIHNLSVATQEDCLTAWQITGHFRYPAGR